MGICTKLPTLPSCCCGCNLRMGTLTLAIIYVIASGIGLAGAVSLFKNLEKDHPDYHYNSAFASLIFNLILYVAQLMLNIFLLVGATRNKPRLLLPYLWMEGFVLIFGLINAILSFLATTNVFTAIYVSVSWLIGLYFFMVVNSFYQQLLVGDPKISV